MAGREYLLSRFEQLQTQPVAEHNMVGNVWEWCADWFSASYHRTGHRADPTGPLEGTAKVMRGGSYLCHDSYCNRYRVGAAATDGYQRDLRRIATMLGLSGSDLAQRTLA